MKSYSIIVGIIILISGCADANSIKEKESFFKGTYEHNERVMRACDSITEILKKIEGLYVTGANGVVEDGKTGKPAIGCKVYVTSKTIQNKRGEFPHDILRKQLESNMWREDITRAGDGPGSTTYSLYYKEVMCIISAVWENATIEDANGNPDYPYKLEVECIEKPANKSL